VNVAFEVVDGDEGLVEAEGEGLCVGDADEERAGEAWTFGYGYGVEVERASLPARTTAAAVSSQELSIPRIRPLVWPVFEPVFEPLWGLSGISLS
jgi:hypothetical protein